MARGSSTLRMLVGVAGLALAAAAAGCGAPGASSGTGGDATTVRLLVCESGTVTDGDVSTSSAVVTRVPDGTAIPPGCRLA